VSRSTNPPPSRRERRAQERLDRPARAPHTGRRKPPSARRAWQSPFAIATGAAILIGLALIVFALPKGSSNGDDLAFPITTYPDELTDGDTLGLSTAPVLIELYSDFQCPACKLFATERLPVLLNDFIKAGIVRIDAKDIAFLGTGSPDESLELAVGASCAAEQDRYWEFHDLVFWNQGRENRGDHDTAFIQRVADAAELDRAAFDACFARTDIRGPITAATTQALGAGINSTPTLLVNGQKVTGVPAYADLAALIQQLAGEASPAASGAAPS
jgi:protein-disulfide isomerase